MKPHHKLKTLKIELETDSRAKGVELQQRFSQLCRGSLKKSIDATFSRLSPGAEIQRLDAITLDLGELKPSISDHQLSIAIEEQLFTQVQQALWSGPVSHMAGHRFAQQPVRARARRSKGEDQPVKGYRENMDEMDESSDDFCEEDWFEGLEPENEDLMEEEGESLSDRMHFLAAPEFFEQSTGLTRRQINAIDNKNKASKEADVNLPTGDARTQELIEFYLKTGQSPWWATATDGLNFNETLARYVEQYRAFVYGLFLENSLVLKRLIFQLSYPELAILIEHKLTHVACIVSLKQCIQRVPSDVFRLSLWKLVQASSKGGIKCEQELVVVKLIEKHRHLETWSFFSEELSRILSTDSSEREDLTANLVQLQFEQLNIDAFSASVELEISNAGLVLLCQWIPEFLAENNLLQEGKFTSQEQRQQAIHLIASLSFKAGFEEFQLALIKVLCGLDLNEPVLQCSDISDEQGLKSLIASFRSSQHDLASMADDEIVDCFVNRKGLLTYRDQSWLLRIESEGRDILLAESCYPTFSFQFPWMVDPMTVEWDMRGQY